jgi:hypothetical protein
MYLPVPRRPAKPPKRPHRVPPRLADVGVQGRLDAARARRLAMAISGAPAGLAGRDGAEVHPVMTQHYTMLQRNLLHTGVTRGKRVVVLVGQEKAVAIAVRIVSGRRVLARNARDGRACYVAAMSKTPIG